MNSMRYVELLSPAKDYDAARAAVDHGADAIYMVLPYLKLLIAPIINPTLV